MGIVFILLISVFLALGLIVIFKELFPAQTPDILKEPDIFKTFSTELFERRAYVFDSVSELNLYRILQELFGDRYYIFPQLPYSRLVKTKRGENLFHRTHFDKKAADFVLCDKERAVAKLVIELDGPSHLSESRKRRDQKVDAMMQGIGLPILHLKVGNFDKTFVKEEVERALSGAVAKTSGGEGV